MSYEPASNAGLENASARAPASEAAARRADDDAAQDGEQAQSASPYAAIQAQAMDATLVEPAPSRGLAAPTAAHVGEGATAPVLASAADAVASVDAQGESAAPTDIDGGKYTYRYSIPLVRVESMVISGRLEASLTGERGDKTKNPNGSSSEDVGATQALRERRKRQVDETGDRVTSRLRVALAQLSNVSDLVEVPLAGIPITLTLETKFLDAELDLENGDVSLDLAKLSFIGRGDLSAIGPEIVPEGFPLDAELRVELRLDVTLSPEVLANVLRMRNAAKRIADAGEVVDKLDRTDKEIARIEKQLADLGDRPGKYPAIYDPKPKLKRRLKDLKANQSKLTKLVDKAKGVSEAATEAYKAARAKLGKGFAAVADSAIGKGLKKALGKFIPIYNAISTAEDIYDVAVFVFNVNERTKEGTQQEGIGDDKEGGDGDQKIEGAVDDAAEPGQGLGGEGDGYDDELLEPVLDPFAPVPLHRAAQAVFDHTSGGPAQLTEEQMQLLNTIIPEDLVESEVAQIMARVYGETVGGSVETGEQYVQSVIDAVRWVQANRRDDGVPGQQGRGDVDDDERQRRREPEPEPARRRDGGRKAPADPGSVAVVDITSQLQARYSFDPVQMEIVGPSRGETLDLGGVRLTIDRRSVAQSPMTDERYAMVLIDFTLEAAPEGATLLLDGALVVASEGASYSTSFGVRGDLPPDKQPVE